MADIFLTYDKSTNKDIFIHLDLCSENFIPSLKLTVNIEDYAKKIREFGHTIEAWKDGILIGLVAFYINRLKDTLFITNVSVLPDNNNNGIASLLIKNMLEYAYENSFYIIDLEVNSKNIKAISVYQKFGFKITENFDDKIKMFYSNK